MYNPKVIEGRLTSAFDALNKRRSHQKPLSPEYHAPSQVQSAVQHFDKIYDAETGKLKRPLDQDELNWVQNERILCQCDFAYWCNPPEAPIWMGDLSFKDLGDVKVGDEVIGWVKRTPDGTVHNSRRGKHDPAPKDPRLQRDYFVKSKVLAVHRRSSYLMKVTMKSGRVIRCTPDHLWSNGSTSRGKGYQTFYTSKGRQRRVYSYPWTKARVGAQLRFAIRPVYRESLNDSQKDTASWLGGIYDGEGSWATISQYKVRNPDVHARIGEALGSLGFKYHESEKGYHISGGRQSYVEFINYCRPIRSRYLERMVLGQVEAVRDEVVSVDIEPESEVISLETETGNYVAWGYMSKNCTRYAYIRDWSDHVSRLKLNVAQKIILSIWGEMEAAKHAILMLQLKARRLGVSTLTELAVAHRIQFYSNVNAVVASSDPDKSAEMAGIMDLAWNNSPWWLMPAVTAHRAGTLLEFGNQNSAVSIQHGTQFSGIARGSTPSVFHLCLSPSTLVISQDGMARPIRELLPGDTVITSQGRVARIKRVVPSHRRNELTSEILLAGNFAPLSTTRDHHILTPNGMKPAFELECGDWVTMPVRPVSSGRKSFTLTAMPWAKTHNKIENRTYNLNRDWGFFFGLYMAEGCIHSTSRSGRTWSDAVLFSVDADEVETFGPRLEKLLGEGSYRLRKSPTSRSRTMVFGDSMLARFTFSEFGQKDSKRIPDWVWDAGREFCKGIVEGYLFGDGHFVPDANEVLATSVRLQIPVQIRSLCASLGYGWSSIYYKPSGFYYGRNCREAWTIAFCGESAQRIRKDFGISSPSAKPSETWKFREDGRFVDIKVEGRSDGWSDEFWDIEVDAPEHDFCTLQCCVSNSEIPDFDDPVGLIDASLLRAVLDTPSTFGVLESTAAGRGNWLHKTWTFSVENWPASTRLRPLFLPYYVGSDLYPTDTWLRQHPVPRNHVFQAVTLRHAERAMEYVRTNDLLRKHLGENWRMPERQMWFWEATRREYEAHGALSKFLAELCSDDVEAFQHDKHNPFGAELINQYHNSTSRITPRVYGFQAREDVIAARLQPDKRDIDPNLAPITFKPLPNATLEAPRHIRLVPLKFQGASTFDPLGKLLIWKDWEPGYTFANGIDTGYGIGKDRSVIETLREGTLDRNEEQVAEFASPYVNPADLAPIAYAVGCLYSGFESGRLRECHQAIEVQANGEITQLQLRKMGWTKFHHWVRYDRRRIRPTETQRLGWATVPWSRALLISWTIKYLRDGWVDVNSPWFVEEMQSLVQDDSQQKLKAEFGEFDDRFMAFGIALVHLNMLAMRLGKKTVAEQRLSHRVIDDIAAPPEEYSFGIQSEPVYAPGIQQMIADREDSW